MMGDRAPTAMQPSRREDFVPYGDGIPVLLVSDVKLLRDGLMLVTAGTSAIRVVGTAATLGEAEGALKTLRPAVVLLDMSIPDGVEIASGVRRADPVVGIIAFAAASDDDAQLACVEAGITGFVPREGGLRELVEATVKVVHGEIFCSPQVIGSTFRRLAELSAAGRGTAAGAPVVSARERQIVDLIDRGLSNKEIAARLQIGLATVKNHVHNILEKLQVARRGEVAARLRQASRRVPRSAPSGDARPQRRD
jgi:two-component system nitrate/nitrite response regulator NarL